MLFLNQIDCFKVNMEFWKFLGINPKSYISPYYRHYSKAFVIIFIIIYDLLFTLNFFFLPINLDSYIENMIFYFTELAVASKVLTFLFMKDQILEILSTFEHYKFQPITDDEASTIKKAKKFNVRYWKIVAIVSFTSNLTHVLSPFIVHLLLPVKLELPVCSYSFLSDEFKQYFIYPLYFYQSVGMHFHMLYNLNIDTFFLGLIVLTIAQIDILDERLRRVTKIHKFDTSEGTANHDIRGARESNDTNQLNKALIHFDEIGKFCHLIQKTFSVTLFVQFSMESCIICVCLFRFTMPAPWQYFIFLGTYMFIMVIQIMVPCWFGTRIMEKSNQLSMAVYDCDWLLKSRSFTRNMRLFMERTRRPLSITGWKMFPLSLKTFTSIMNTAYSFFTLLRNMQSRE